MKPAVPADEVIAAIEAWKSLWCRVPPFGNKVNKATRYAVSESHGPLFVLLNKAQDAQRAQSTPDVSVPPTGSPTS